MSLISEALKKARQEVARQDADRIGGVAPALPHHMPLRRRERPAWLAALIGGFVGAAIVCAALLWVYRPWSSAPTLEPAPVTAIPPATAVPAVSPHRASSIPAVAPATPVVNVAAATPIGPEPTAGATAEIASVALPPVIARAVEAAPQSPAVAPSARAVATTPAPATTEPPIADSVVAATPLGVSKVTGDPPAEPPPYRVQLADGKELVLNGIAAGEGAPVALINRRAVGLGESVDGWQVSAIEPRRVVLVRGEQTVELSLRKER